MSDEIDIGVLAESFAEFLGAEWPREKAVAFARGDAPMAADLWTQAGALGWTALTVSEAHGGLGLGTQAAAALHEALGAAAAPLPMLSNTLAVALVDAAGTQEQQDALVAGLSDSSQRAAVASPGSSVIGTDGAELNGVVADVLDAPSATLLFLRGSRAGQPVWIALPAEAAGVTIGRSLLADTSRSLGTVTLHNVALTDAHVLAEHCGPSLDDELLRLAAIALAADSLGCGNAVLAATIEYMGVREQFGRLIGSFQALKHRVADHKAALEAARGLVEHASALPSTAPDALLAALTAKQHVTRIVAEIARDCIQLHGGVGFTSEYVPHIYLKRAKLNEVLFGTRTMLLDRIADILEAA
ncbi:acyl-CoA dehydrogenase family protein [Blastomonas fulva]|uniref:acyl-CoA dehydrogenase family protein n=1 Tax=Blastomonas fulva TaxID=1550728 RepID=UPI003F70BE38